MTTGNKLVGTGKIDTFDQGDVDGFPQTVQQVYLSRLRRFPSRLTAVCADFPRD